MDLVTIIIPIYNIERKYLERCVRSVYEQDYEKLEIILVDDGATDGTGQVCDELALMSTDTHTIRVLHKDNGGSSSARNYGIDHANGEYLGFVDSDDYIDSDFVSLMMAAMKSNGLKMVQISRDEIDTDGNRRPDVCIPPETETIITSHDQMRELLMHKGDCSYCTRLCHRSLFENRRFPVGRLNEDFYLLVQMLDDVDKYMILPKQAYHVFYRIGSNSRRANPNDFSRVFIDIVDNADYVEEIVARKYPDLVPVAKRFALYQRLDYMLHIPIAQMKSDNVFYRQVVRYLRDNYRAMRSNPHLTKKNKVYLTLLTWAPVVTRRIHSVKLKIAG